MLSPYEITPIQNGCTFTTTGGNVYTCYFDDVTATLSSPVPAFSFGFAAAKPLSSLGYDPRVSHTIVKVLDDFFCTRNEVVIYSPSDIDGREMCRVRLFDKWWNSYEDFFVCEDLETERAIIAMGETNLVVTIFFRSSQRETAQEILSGQIPDLMMEGKDGDPE